MSCCKRDYELTVFVFRIPSAVSDSKVIVVIVEIIRIMKNTFDNDGLILTDYFLYAPVWC